MRTLGAVLLIAGMLFLQVKDPKNLESVKVGDLFEVTCTQALAVSLDKPAT